MQISIHALREEGDEEETQVFTDELAFLSTPSARRATYTSAWNELQEKNFYPRPPRGGRQLARNQSSASSTFLSTPSARRATAADQHRVLVRIFLSTPSARRAT